MIAIIIILVSILLYFLFINKPPEIQSNDMVLIKNIDGRVIYRLPINDDIDWPYFYNLYGYNNYYVHYPNGYHYYKPHHKHHHIPHNNQHYKPHNKPHRR